MSTVWPFKMRPNGIRNDPYGLNERPMTGSACDTCFGTEADTAINQEKHEPRAIPRVCDVLNVPIAACSASFGFIKRMCDIVHCLTLGQYKYPRVDADVLASERMKNGIAKNTAHYMDDEDDTLRSVPDTDLPIPSHKKQSKETAIAKERVKAKSMLKQMRAHISVWVQAIAGYILFKLLRFILRTVQVSPHQIEKLKQAAAHGVPLIYLPNHRSHLDYVLLSFVLAQFGLRTPYVAAGDNLDIPLFSWLMQSLGAFFIKRQMGKDHVYRAVLHSYMEELLKHGESLEFFVEGGRSRTGRMLLPKAGLLSMVVETHLQGAMPNAYIVPVSVSYEKVIERSFSSEIMGEPKTKETFRVAIKGIWKVFTTKYGSVRIDFGQPISIKDYLGSLKTALPPLPSADAAFPSSSFDVIQPQSSSKSLASRNSRLSMCSGFDVSMLATDENRRLIRLLCNHIAFDFTSNCSLMCTQLLAFLLTSKYRRGGRLDDVVDDFRWLRDHILASGHDVGFSGDPQNVVRYAIELMGQELVNLEISDMDSGVVSDSGCGNGCRHEKDSTESHLWIVKPATSVARRHDLAYYAAPVATMFLHEALISNVILAMSMEANKSDHRPVETASSSPSTRSNPNTGVNSSKIIDRAMTMADLLQNEFLFVRPCGSLRQCLEKTLERMRQEGLIKRDSASFSPSPSSITNNSVRFCLERNQIWSTATSSSTSSRRSSVTTLFGASEDDPTTNSSSRRRKTGEDGSFYVASEDEDMADYEDEGDQDEDLFSSTKSTYPTSSTDYHRNSPFGIASLVDNDDDYNTDILRMYASSLGPILESYKFAVRTALMELSQPAAAGTLTKTEWKREPELLRTLMNEAKKMERENRCRYVEFISVENMRNTIKWLISKGVLMTSRDRLRLHEAYIDDREALERMCQEVDDLCIVITY